MTEIASGRRCGACRRANLRGDVQTTLEASVATSSPRSEAVEVTWWRAMKSFWPEHSRAIGYADCLTECWVRRGMPAW
jgi:hypothetical protein